MWKKDHTSRSKMGQKCRTSWLKTQHQTSSNIRNIEWNLKKNIYYNNNNRKGKCLWSEWVEEFICDPAALLNWQKQVQILVSEVGDRGLAETDGSLLNSFHLSRERINIISTRQMIISAKFSETERGIWTVFTVFGLEPITPTTNVDEQFVQMT